jgi:hypothetical protein
MTDAVIQAAAREFNALPESVQNWIDAPDEFGARLGNNEDVVIALALRPFARLSPEAASRELERIRSGPAYAKGDPIAVAKARMLNLVIAGKSTEPKAPTAPPQPRAFGTRGGDDVQARVGAKSAAELRAELKALQDPKSELFSSDGPKRKRAIARRQEIQAQLGGSP